MSDFATTTYFDDGRLASARYAGGGLAVEAGDTTRTVTSWDEQGMLIPSTTEAPNPRPYTPEENADADAAAVVKQERLSREATRTAVKAIITDLQAEKARCNVVIAKSNATITGADTKDVARAGKRIADAAIELARFVRDM